MCGRFFCKHLCVPAALLHTGGSWSRLEDSKIRGPGGTKVTTPSTGPERCLGGGPREPIRDVIVIDNTCQSFRPMKLPLATVQDHHSTTHFLAAAAAAAAVSCGVSNLAGLCPVALPQPSRPDVSEQATTSSHSPLFSDLTSANMEQHTYRVFILPLPTAVSNHHGVL